MTATFTHTINSRKLLRYLPHHHRGPALNKTHAVASESLRVRDGAEAETVCGMVVRIEELPEVLATDGGPLYNCRAVTAASRVTCKDCLVKLGM